MRVAYFDYTLDFSVRIYIDNVVRELEVLGVEMRPFQSGDNLPAADLYWDPRLTGGTPPWHRLKDTPKPIVVTLHDGSPLALLPWEYYESIGQAVRGLWGVAKRLVYWQGWRGRCAAIITVSQSAAQEIRTKLRLPDVPIVPIYHGVNHDLFSPIPSPPPTGNPYLLHISQYQPIKNVSRIFAAYRRLSLPGKPRLHVILPYYPEGPPPADGIDIIRQPHTQTALVPLYQRALGFVFPSLHESFGLPILEAMACGCPVVTSNVAACPEVAGDAALLIDPRSVDEIATVMQRLIEDSELRATLRQKGLDRAQQFTWRKSARQHLAVFEEALRHASG